MLDTTLILATSVYPRSKFKAVSILFPPSSVHSPHSTAVLITPDDSGRPLPATQLAICIRCYEARIGKAGISRSLLLLEHSQILWSKNADVDYEPISDLSVPFKIVLPASIGGYSTLTLPDYRIFWKLDAGNYSLNTA